MSIVNGMELLLRGRRADYEGTVARWPARRAASQTAATASTAVSATGSGPRGHDAGSCRGRRRRRPTRARSTGAASCPRARRARGRHGRPRARSARRRRPRRRARMPSRPARRRRSRCHPRPRSPPPPRPRPAAPGRAERRPSATRAHPRGDPRRRPRQPPRAPVTAPGREAAQATRCEAHPDADDRDVEIGEHRLAEQPQRQRAGRDAGDLVVVVDEPLLTRDDRARQRVHRKRHGAHDGEERRDREREAGGGGQRHADHDRKCEAPERAHAERGLAAASEHDLGAGQAVERGVDAHFGTFGATLLASTRSPLFARPPPPAFTSSTSLSCLLEDRPVEGAP